jgi:hypothetical protein
MIAALASALLLCVPPAAGQAPAGTPTPAKPAATKPAPPAAPADAGCGAAAFATRGAAAFRAGDYASSLSFYTEARFD